jgi:hypothetical protein
MNPQTAASNSSTMDLSCAARGLLTEPRSAVSAPSLHDHRAVVVIVMVVTATTDHRGRRSRLPAAGQ